MQEFDCASPKRFVSICQNFRIVAKLCHESLLILESNVFRHAREQLERNTDHGSQLVRYSCKNRVEHVSSSTSGAVWWPLQKLAKTSLRFLPSVLFVIVAIKLHYCTPIRSPPAHSNFFFLSLCLTQDVNPAFLLPVCTHFSGRRHSRGVDGGAARRLFGV